MSSAARLTVGLQALNPLRTARSHHEWLLVTSLLTEDLRSMPGADVSLAWASYWVPPRHSAMHADRTIEKLRRDLTCMWGAAQEGGGLEMANSAVALSALIKASRAGQQQCLGVGGMGESCACCCLPMHSAFQITNRHPPPVQAPKLRGPQLHGLLSRTSAWGNARTRLYLCII
ncbi:uncharacterized protein B0H64DRAFT_34093 [Chaetomium fimeti]|uniref:Uncharacterized protein n=1 Tax=Chaetomium fimeti TaxID=1854472 RepID=A0AAE0LYE5_9PEZI|nr:hypothetical protein B0H64DRAFT_34093 [Chaetomium fimeti]